MGSGNSTPAKVEPTNPVRQLFLAAESDVEKKEIQKAIASYQKAQSITTDDKVKEYIHYRLSLLASKDDGVVRPAETTNKRKIQKSQEASVYDSQGKYDEALEYYNKALTIYLNKLGEDHPDVAMTYMNLGKLCEKLEQYQTALEYYEKAKPIYSRSHNGQYDAYFDGRIEFCKNAMEKPSE